MSRDWTIYGWSIDLDELIILDVVEPDPLINIHDVHRSWELIIHDVHGFRSVDHLDQVILAPNRNVRGRTRAYNMVCPSWQ
jgi:hypothetical protein